MIFFMFYLQCLINKLLHYCKDQSLWVHQAGLIHAISLISVKLGQFKGFYPKTPKNKPVGSYFGSFRVETDDPPSLVLLYFYQGKCYNIRQE